MNAKLMRAAAAAALVAGMGGAAHATEGWYGRLDLGYSVDGALEVQGADLDFEDDWTGHAGLGYGFQNGFRFEGELGYRTNDFEDFDGDATALSLMANLFYDFNRGGSVQPYVGIGVGGARIDVDGIAGPISFDDDDTVIAYQGLIGLAFAISQQLSLDVGYRYFTAPDLDMTGIIDIEVPEPFDFDADYMHQAVTVGLRYQFGAPAAPVQVSPPPPPPPAPPPPVACPTSEFVVYFEWDRSNLNEAALETIDSAVARARECNVGSVIVIGHTDTSGSAAYNVGLSERRASVVRDALVARGVPASLMTSEARGETDLAQPTRDGVREPLNRRTAVTITFR